MDKSVFEKPELIKDPASFKEAEVLDTTYEQLEELFLIRNPHLRSTPEKIPSPQKTFVEENLNKGVWFYFPWRNQMVRFLDPTMHQELRTARNRLLITESEQDKFRKYRVAVAGLSVGSSVAYTLAVTGGGESMKLADPDEISGSNMNRLRAGFFDIGRKKLFVAAEQIYSLNPYADLKLYGEGVNANNISEFLSDVDVLAEEMDDLALKILIRLEARKKKLPVVMATDNGDGVMIDVERFDLDPQAPIFHGLVDEQKILNEIEQGSISPQTRVSVSTKIVGLNNIPSRMLESLSLVGQKLYSWPQLGSSAFTAGASLSFVIRSICLNYPIKSGRYVLSYDKILFSDQTSEQKAQEKMVNLFRRLGIA